MREQQVIEVASQEAHTLVQEANRTLPITGTKEAERGIAAWLFFHPEERDRFWWFDSEGRVQSLRRPLEWREP